jgi:FkbM family methyltransferase
MRTLLTTARGILGFPPRRGAKSDPETTIRGAESDLEATIIAADRRLKMIGTHSSYMQSLRGWRADHSAVAMAVKDIPNASLCLDVGAHIGLTAIIAAVLRPDCRIVAFEPMPAAQKRFRQNLAANNIENIELVEAAVADLSGTVSFDDNGPWSVATTGSVRYKTIRLDDLVLGAPAFIKIDVEGFEPNVLAGASRLLAEARPLILMEFNSWTLLLHHYDPLTFAAAIWSSFDVLRAFHEEKSVTLSPDPLKFCAYEHNAARMLH